jgi:hydroxymethylglutaryl-CoA lyase
MVEVGPRDGLQSEQLPVSTADKISLINQLSGTGLPVVEATAFVSKSKVPMMADAEDVFKGITQVDGVSYPVLTPTMRQFERSLAVGVKEVAVFTAVSESFCQKNIGCSIDGSFERFQPLMDLAMQEGVKVRGYVSCVAGCPYEGPTSQVCT